MNNCNKCGTKLPQDSSFCPECGSPTAVESGQPQPTRSEKMDSGITSSIDFPVKISMPFEEKASRIELFVRIVLGWVYGIIAGVWGFLAAVANIIQWFHILFTAKRNATIWNFVQGYYRYAVRVSSYTLLLTDKRPPISGQ